MEHTKTVASIVKRDGRAVPFDESKIAAAVERAFAASGAMQGRPVADQIARAGRKD